MECQRWSPGGCNGGILPWKIFKIEVLGNGMSGIGSISSHCSRKEERPYAQQSMKKIGEVKFEKGARAPPVNSRLDLWTWHC